MISLRYTKPHTHTTRALELGAAVRAEGLRVSEVLHRLDLELEDVSSDRGLEDLDGKLRHLKGFPPHTESDAEQNKTQARDDMTHPETCMRRDIRSYLQAPLN